MANLKVAGLDIGSHNLTIDEPSGTLLVDGEEVSASGGGISYVWADEIARTAQTSMKVNEQGLQKDTGWIWKFSEGLIWVKLYKAYSSYIQSETDPKLNTDLQNDIDVGDEWFDLTDGTLYKRVGDGTDTLWMGLNNTASSNSVYEIEEGVEHFTGRVRNGKLVYSIEIDFGALPNSTSKLVSIPNHTSSNFYWVNDADSYVSNSSNNTYSVNMPYPNNSIFDIRTYVDNVNGVVTIQSTHSYSTSQAKIVVNYTKN